MFVIIFFSNIFHGITDFAAYEIQWKGKFNAIPSNIKVRLSTLCMHPPTFSSIFNDSKDCISVIKSRCGVDTSKNDNLLSHVIIIFTHHAQDTKRTSHALCCKFSTPWPRFLISLQISHWSDKSIFFSFQILPFLFCLTLYFDLLKGYGNSYKSTWSWYWGFNVVTTTFDQWDPSRRFLLIPNCRYSYHVLIAIFCIVLLVCILHSTIVYNLYNIIELQVLHSKLQWKMIQKNL